MAYEIPVLLATFRAAGDLSAKQYHFVKLDSNGDVVICAAATDKPIGVLQNNPASGSEAAVMILGISKVSADAALSVGALIGTSADGQADAKTPGTDAMEYIAGMVLSATGAAGGIASASINCASLARAA